MKELYIDEHRCLVGTSAVDNDLVLYTAKKQDQNAWWFHLQSIPSAHLVLFVPDPKLYLYQVKRIILEHTPRAPRNQHIIYTQVKNVSKTNTPGTVVPKHTKTY